MLIFDDQSEKTGTGRKSARAGIHGRSFRTAFSRQIGTDVQPGRQIFFLHAQEHQPKYDVMDLKALEDWVLEKQFKSVPNVVDVWSLGRDARIPGPRRSGQGDLVRAEHRARWSSKLANNNLNAGEASSKKAFNR